MPVNVIDTLKPKNNGEFAVVEAVDVAVSSGKRLPAALAEKADASALAETNTAVQSKANASDVETKTANLQAQINSIITPVTQDAEVQNARTNASGTTFTTLKTRLDASDTAVSTKASQTEVTGLKEDLSELIEREGLPITWARAQISIDGTIVSKTTDDCSCSNANIVAKKATIGFNSDVETSSVYKFYRITVYGFIDGEHKRVTLAPVGIPSIPLHSLEIEGEFKVCFYTTDSSSIVLGVPDWAIFDVTYPAQYTFIDKTLTIEGIAGDSKAIGDKFNDIEGDISDIDNTIFERSESVKNEPSDLTSFTKSNNLKNNALLISSAVGEKAKIFTKYDRITDFKIEIGNKLPTLNVAVLNTALKITAIYNIQSLGLDGEYTTYNFESITFTEDSHIAIFVSETSAYMKYYDSYDAIEGLVPTSRWTVETSNMVVGITPPFKMSARSTYNAIGYKVETSTNKIEAIEDRIDNIQVEYKLPAIWESKVEEIQTEAKNDFTFIIQTDLHFHNHDADEGYNINYLARKIPFDFVANLGDIIRGYANEDDTNEYTRSYLTEIISRYTNGITCPLMLMQGNHENNLMYSLTFSTPALSQAELYRRIMKPCFNATKPIHEYNKFYYYKDIDGIRVIVLHTNDGTIVDGSGATVSAIGITDEQITWLRTVALDTNLPIMVMCHVPLVNGWSVSSNYVPKFAEAVSELQTFKTNGGIVIGCFYGHTHTQESQKLDGIWHITFRNGNYGEVVMVDRTTYNIKTKTIGFSGDRTFTH